ncbi:prion-inhibition and propagation-domain-containing protein [Schizothecium vesticola]|uniref:Prion-inhibition and propagation-domain-containing protein n=1 Tax=Schizothecium vesticola TaxID=314040 RepID=A0AA40EHB0_9PEZI|nr:prion-inhibition and propagation-domain-containing protein [Schizothecium vesticola]
MAGVGEAVGVIGLAALFSTCVECFGYFKASQRIDKDSEILLVKLDIEKARLLFWGGAVRIFETNSSTPYQNSILHDEAARQLLGRCLKSIESVLTDAERLTRDYGVVEEHHPSQREIDFVSANSMAVFQTSWRRFFVRNSSALPRRNGLLARTKWAIYKKELFQGLINHLKDLVDGLYELAPPPLTQMLSETVEADVECLTNLDQLRLFEAATEDSYRAWSAVASSVISASEAGTIASRAADGDVGDLSRLAIGDDVPHQTPYDFIDELKQASPNPLVALTATCLKLSTQHPCNMLNLGREITKAPQYRWPFSHASIYDTRHSLARRVDGIFNLATDLRSELEDLGGSFVLHEIMTDHNLTHILFPLAITYIHCAPCVCQLQTAVHLCFTVSSTLHNYSIRPDDRLMTSCCIRQNRIDGLRSIYEAVRHSESLAVATKSPDVPIVAKYIDMVWLEERLYFLESGDNLRLPAQKIKTTQVVVLSEAEHLRSLMARFLCPKVPRASEIWSIDLSDASHLVSQYCGTFTSKSRLSGEVIPDASESNPDPES